VAAWQCDFHLVPRRELHEPGRPAPEAIAAARARDTRWWRRVDPPPDLLALAAAAAPPAPSWSDRLRTFGREDGHRIDVWVEGARTVSVLVRFDLRLRDRRFLDAVVALARRADACLVRADGLVVPADAAALGEALATSAAARFVADPEAYRRRVRLGGPADG
jgi:hypothetical protein